MGVQQLSYLFPVLLIFVFYFLLIRPQKKREKKVRDMRENLKVGNKVVSIGGIHGRVVKIKDDVLTLEVGPDKAKVPFARWAISSVDNGNQQVVKETKAKKADAAKATEEVKEVIAEKVDGNEKNEK